MIFLNPFYTEGKTGSITTADDVIALSLFDFCNSIEKKM